MAGSTTPAANASKTKMQYHPETVGYKQLPASPTFIRMRYTGESLAQSHETEESQEITEDRAVSDVVRNSVRTAGDTNHELSYGSQDDFIHSALFADAAVGAAIDNTDNDISLATSDNSVNTAAGDFVADGYQANEWLILKNTTTGADPIFAKVVSVATGKMVLSHYDIPSDVSAGDNWRLYQPGHMDNGITCVSYAIEREYDSTIAAAARWALFDGQIINQMNIGFEATGKLTIGFSWLGSTETSPGATASTGGAPTAPNTNQVLNVVDHLRAVQQDGTVRNITGLSLTLNNNLQELIEAGILGASEIIPGTVQVSGSVEFYYRDAVEYDKYLAFTNSGISFVFMDDSDQGYIMDVPLMNYSSGVRAAEGQNQPITVPLGFTAKKDPTEGKVIRIYPFAL